MVIIAVNSHEYLLISSAGGRNGVNKNNLQSHTGQHYEAHSEDMRHSLW